MAVEATTRTMEEEVLDALRMDCEMFAAMASPAGVVDMQLATVNAQIDAVVARLAEFAAFAELVRAERDAGSAMAPQLAAKAHGLVGEFAKIDAVEDLVRRMTAAIAELEERAETVERFLSAHARKSLLRAIPGLGNRRISEPELPEWKPIAVPHAQDLIPHPTTTGSTTSAAPVPQQP